MNTKLAGLCAVLVACASSNPGIEPDAAAVGPLADAAPDPCIDGVCNSACAIAEAQHSYIGCEYWPVDLGNAVEVFFAPVTDASQCEGWQKGAVFVEDQPVCATGPTGSIHGLCDFGGDCLAAGPDYTCQPVDTCVVDGQHSRFAVVVSNPQDRQVTVTLSNATGTEYTTEIEPRAVLPIYPQEVGFDDQSLDHSGVSARAYKLTSSHPVVAYQFNPLDNELVFSNDGSLLLPRHSFDTDYYAASYETVARRPLNQDHNGYVAVVASASGSTSVVIDSPVAIRAGNGVPAFGPGTAAFSLGQFEVLALEAMPGADPSGIRISSDRAVAVFGGHEASTVWKQSPTCCADHLEDQLLPTSRWGERYVVAKSTPRMHETTAEPVPDLVRIIARVDATSVVTTPAVAGCGLLIAGQHCDIWIDDDLEIIATEPVLVAHYFAGAGGTQPASGDPSLSFAVPVEQYRFEYDILIPEGYDQNFAAVVAPDTSTVSIDGADVTPQLSAFSTSPFRTGQIPLEPGQHRIECNNGCGVELYGFSDAVSYLLSGGLDLAPIYVP